MRIMDIKGGLAKSKGVTKKDVDPKEFAMGVEVEKEHTSDTHRIEQTVLDHLAENPKYYTILKRAKLEGVEMENKELHKEAITLLKRLIKEQVMSYYTKEADKNVKKYEKLKKPEKERMANEDGYRDSDSNETKQELVKNLLELSNKYNTTQMRAEELIEELVKIGKAVGAKKDIVEQNYYRLGKGFDVNRKLYVYDLAEMMLETPQSKSGTIGDHKPEEKETSKEFWAKDKNKEFKKAPEKAEKVSDEVREEGKEETKEKKSGSDSLGKSEAAKGDPKGVKKMKEEKPTKFKSFLTGKGKK